MRLYITVETTSRELDAKTLLACCAAASGFDVVIGLEDMVRRLCRFSKPGIFFDKSLHSEYPPLFKKLKKRGYLIAVSDEEGLAGDHDQYCKFGIGKGVADTVDMIFTWGEVQKRLIHKTIPDYSGEVVEAGNPRIDILDADIRRVFDSQVYEIKKKYGNFILINTRYGFSNNVIGGDQYREKIVRGDMGKKIDFLLRCFDFEAALWDEFFRMTMALSQRYPDRNIILRPHPSESIEKWQEALRGLKNVRVVREGNVHPWILASDMLIHNGCSTAIEALLLDVPCFCYRPILSEECDVELPNSVSFNVYDIECLYRCIDSPADYYTEKNIKEWKNILAKNIKSISGKKSIGVIVESLKKLSCKDVKASFLLSNIMLIAGYCSHLCRVFKYRIRKKEKKSKSRPNSKWISLSLDEFKDIARKYEFYDESFKNLEITNAYYDCFRIQKK